MGLYEKIRETAKNNGYSINRLEKELGFARSSISKFNKNVPSMEKIKQIAEKLGVTTDYLLSEDSYCGSIITCTDCGLTYDASLNDDIKQHSKEHLAWEKAVEKFGNLYCYSPECERIKAINRSIRNNKNNSIEDRFNAELEVLRCLFSRSVSALGYSLSHPTFNDYVAMMMNNKQYRKTLGDEELCDKIIEKYGVLPGIECGTVYIPTTQPQTIAAHKDDGEVFTEDELKKIEEYKKLLIAARPKE